MRVLITQEVDPVAIEILEAAGHSVELRVGPTPMPPDELKDRLEGCAALIPMPTNRIDAALLSTPGLRIVACHSVGTDHVDLAAARAAGVVVTHTPGVLTDATADLTLALLLALARRLGEGERLLRAGGFQGWRPTMLRGLDLRGATLGILGYGRIGQAVAARARAFGMEILWSRSREGTSLSELLARSDVLSVHCPLTEQTRHLLDARALSRMKHGALLLNTARGPIVDEDALVAALEAGQLGGAGLDVFEHEPQVHPGLMGREDVVLLPHLGSATWGTRREMARKAAANVVEVLAGRGAADRVGPPG